MEFFEKLMMLYECLHEGTAPPEAGRYATARVKVFLFDYYHC